MASEATDPSRAPPKGPELEAPERRWVILSSRPAIVDWAWEEEGFEPGSDALRLYFYDPPRLYKLLLPRRICPGYPAEHLHIDLRFDNHERIPPAIVAVDYGCVLLCATQGHGAVGNAYFLYNAHSGRLTRLPPVPARLGIDFPPRLAGRGDKLALRRVGLIADPRRAGKYVAVLHSTFDKHQSTLLYYSTDTDSWNIKDLAFHPADHRAHDDILSHYNGKLYWFDCKYGVVRLSCDPFADELERRIIPLPSSCNIHINDGHCCILRPSQGKMRLLAIHSVPGKTGELMLGLWTLTDPVDEPPWDLEYQVPFHSIWADDTYKAWSLQPVLPYIKLIDPSDCNIVYLCQGNSLFALDVPMRRVLSCQDRKYGPPYVIPSFELRVWEELHAWELPSTVLESSYGMKVPDEVRVETAMVQRPWVILMSIPFVEPEDSIKILPGTDVLLEFKDPPAPSNLFLRSSISPDQKGPNCFPYILATEPSGILLLHATQGSGLGDTAFFLCNAHASTISRLPDVPNDFTHRLRPRRSIGLIVDTHRIGSCIIAQLIPTSSTCHYRLLYYSTTTKAWGMKWLDSSPVHKPWAGHGVFSHKGMLWWIDVAYGMLTCDPFLDKPNLRFVQLPHCCSQKNIDGNVIRVGMDEKRMIRLSEGKIRYLEIHEIPGQGPAVSMCTLVDEMDIRWQFEYQALFKEIWMDKSYKVAELPRGKVPTLALVDPKNHGVLYFFHGFSLFALDVRARRVLHRCECPVDPFLEKSMSSRFISSWELA